MDSFLENTMEQKAGANSVRDAWSAFVASLTDSCVECQRETTETLLADALLATISSAEGLRFARRLEECLKSAKPILFLPDDLALVLRAHFSSTDPPLIEEELVEELKKSIQTYMRTGKVYEREEVLITLIKAYEGITDKLGDDDRFTYARICYQLLDQHGDQLVNSVYAEVSEESKPYLPPKNEVLELLEVWKEMLRQAVPPERSRGILATLDWKVLGLVGLGSAVVCGAYAYWRWDVTLHNNNNK